MPIARPNIVFIMPDQLRADFLSCYGASFIDTPHIDALAAHGVRYQRAYSPHPVCVAARAALISGMDAVQSGVLDNGLFLRPDYRACGMHTWPELLDRHDYYTVATGKMHFYPWEERLGFHRRIIAEDKLWGYIEDDYYHFLAAQGHSKTSFCDQPEYHQNFMALTSPIPWEYSVDHFVGRESVRWIEQYDGTRPFAMMVGFPGPHSPYDPSPEFASFRPEDMPEPLPAVAVDTRAMQARTASPNTSAKSWYAVRNEGSPGREHFLLQRACYAGLIKQIDHEVGAIVEALRHKGILDNTVIVFSSDHGDYLGDHGLQGKASFFESACRVPMIVRHPDIDASRVCGDLVGLTDVTATILDLAGCALPGYMEARPLPALGASSERPREHLVGALQQGWMILEGAWKLSKYAGGSVHLFNLEEDPTEQHNRARDPLCTAILQHLDAALTAAIMHSMSTAFFPQRVYTSSHSSSPDFGRVGWARTYPMTWQQLHPEEAS